MEHQAISDTEPREEHHHWGRPGGPEEIDEGGGGQRGEEHWDQQGGPGEVEGETIGIMSVAEQSLIYIPIVVLYYYMFTVC